MEERGKQAKLASSKSTTTISHNDDNESECNEEINKRLDTLEKDTKEIRNITDELREMILAVQSSMTKGTTDHRKPISIAKPITLTKSKQPESPQIKHLDMNTGKDAVCVQVLMLHKLTCQHSSTHPTVL